MERSAALDFSRFAAALVVFSGHLFFVPNSMNWSDSTILFLNPIRTGDTAVLFFFALSGYVLSLGTRKEYYFGWVVSRIVRLFPIYICAWFLGFLLVVLHKSELISPKVVLLGVIGFQSLDPEVMLYVNAPLWSLSVEIVVAFFLIYLLKLKSRPILLFACLIFALVFWMNFSWSPILRALPFFLLGILISNEKVRSLYPHSRVSLLIIFVGGVFYIFRGATWLVDLPGDIASDMYKLFLVSFLIFLLSRIEISKKLAKYAIACGKRSFSLYAFHYPILLAMNYFIQPATLLSFAIYAILSLIGTFACTEFAYRFIDHPSIAASKRVKGWFF
jgi:peptidoglycan/LPS O-acetylase OafA/YrhL